MSKKGLVGLTKCPYHAVCGNDEAEVRLDKRGNLYIVCYECEPVSQHFTRGAPQRVKALHLESFAEKAAPAPAPAPPAPSPKAAREDPPQPAPPKKKGLFSDLEGKL